MNLATTFSPRIIVTALAFKVTQPDLIRLLFCPLIEVSQQSIVFHEIASMNLFLFFSALSSSLCRPLRACQTARLRQEGDGRGCLSQKSLGLRARQEAAHDRIVLKFDS